MKNLIRIFSMLAVAPCCFAPKIDPEIALDSDPSDCEMASATNRAWRVNYSVQILAEVGQSSMQINTML